MNDRAQIKAYGKDPLDQYYDDLAGETGEIDFTPPTPSRLPTVAIGCLLALLIVVLFGGLVQAAEIKRGEIVRVTGTVLCDTQEQLETILVAQQENWQAGVSEYRKLKATKNHLGDISCSAVSAPRSQPFQMVKNMTVVRGVKQPNGSAVDLHIVAVLYMYKQGRKETGYIFLQKPILDARLDSSL